MLKFNKKRKNQAATQDELFKSDKIIQVAKQLIIAFNTYYTDRDSNPKFNMAIKNAQRVGINITPEGKPVAKGGRNKATKRRRATSSSASKTRKKKKHTLKPRKRYTRGRKEKKHKITGKHKKK